MACSRAPRSKRGDLISDGEQTVVRCSDCRSRRRLGYHTLPAIRATLSDRRRSGLGGTSGHGQLRLPAPLQRQLPDACSGGTTA